MRTLFKQEPKILFDLHLASSETSDQENEQIFTTAGEICKPFYSGHVTGHKMPSSMSV